jgi:hypothetical protein
VTLVNRAGPRDYGGYTRGPAPVRVRREFVRGPHKRWLRGHAARISNAHGAAVERKYLVRRKRYDWLMYALAELRRRILSTRLDLN